MEIGDVKCITVFPNNKQALNFLGLVNTERGIPPKGQVLVKIIQKVKIK